MHPRPVCATFGGGIGSLGRVCNIFCIIIIDYFGGGDNNNNNIADAAMPVEFSSSSSLSDVVAMVRRGIPPN